MGVFDAEFAHDLLVESWSWYSVGICLVCIRLYARIYRFGLRSMRIDDYLMVLIGGLYTVLIVVLNAICQGGGSNLYPPELAGTFTPEKNAERIQGSKLVIVSEQAMLNLIYAIKTCMLLLYTRLTLSPRLLHLVALYAALGFLATEAAFFALCRPFPDYWAMTPPDVQCRTYERYAVVQGLFNVTSDLFILAVPVPAVLRAASMPLRQKVVVLLIFGMGGFVVVAAVLTKVFNLMYIWDPAYMLWYVREASVAVYVANMPALWPLLRDRWLRIKPAKVEGARCWHGQKDGVFAGAASTAGGSYLASVTSCRGRGVVRKSVEMQDAAVRMPKTAWAKGKMVRYSGEGGVGKDRDVARGLTLEEVDRRGIHGGIQVETTVEVWEEVVAVESGGGRCEELERDGSRGQQTRPAR